MKKSDIFENLVMNFSIDTEELSKADEKKRKAVPARLEILAEGLAARWSLEQINQKLEENECEKLYARSFYEACLIYAFEHRMDYEEWKFGTRNEGTTYALHSFFRKLAQGIGPSLGLMAATWLGYNAALGANQTIEVATNMRYLTAGAYLLSAVLQLIAYGVIYNLDKKTLAQMEKDLGKRRDDAKADLSKIIGGED